MVVRVRGLGGVGFVADCDGEEMLADAAAMGLGLLFERFEFLLGENLREIDSNRNSEFLLVFAWFLGGWWCHNVVLHARFVQSR